jgi:hypothetical protein
MVHALPSPSCTRKILVLRAKGNRALHPGKNVSRGLIFLAALVLLSPFLLAQNNPQVSGVDPASGKVNDDVTIAGENLGKATVVAVFLSDDKMDYKATIVDQSADKIVMKVPQVKAGAYNISVQVGTNILIKPVKFTVQE